MRKTLLLFTFLIIFTGLVQAESVWNSPWEAEPSFTKLTIIESSPASLVIKIELNGYFSETVNLPEGSFTRIRLNEDFESVTNVIGFPELPQIAEFIRIPRHTRPVITEISGSYSEVENILPYPYQPPLKDGETQKDFVYSQASYVTETLFPEEAAVIEDIGIWRDLQIGSLKFRPLQYSGAEQTMRIYREMTVRIEFTADPAGDYAIPGGKTSRMFEQIYSSSVLNYQPLLQTDDETDDEVGIQYLIICEDRALNGITPLADFRNKMGMRTEVVVPDASLSTPEQIKQYIKDLYLSDGLQYVLLVEDPNINTGTPSVPMYYWTINPQNMTYSDSWYSCLVPGSDSDHYPEIAVGRITYDNLMELDLIVNKTLNYLTGYDTGEDWFQKSLLVAHQENYPLKYTQCKEEVRSFNYSIQNPVFTSIYGGAGGNNNDVINYINSGSCGLFNYRGHGSETTWPAWGAGGSLTNSNIVQMNNQNRLFVLFDVCCSNNNVVTYNGTCLAESFMQANYAAVAVHGAIEPSYTDPNHVFDKEFYKAIYNEGINNIGYASNYAAIETMNNFGGLGQDNFRMYFWQGDPALDLWTHTPAEPEVTVQNDLVIGGQALGLEVLVDGIPCEDALVCLQNEEIYAMGYTDPSGYCQLSIFPPAFQGGVAYLTVSGHNVAFHTDTLDIGGGLGSIEGYVTSNASGEIIDSALVQIPMMALETYTDENGYYSLPEVPALMDQNIFISHPDYLTHEEEGVQLTIGENRQLDFHLLHAECNPSLEQITAYVMPGETGSSDFIISNDGDGALEFTTEITGEGSGATLYSRMSVYVSSETGDNEIYGVTFDGESFWISGEGDAASNMIYQFDSEGEFVSSFDQPLSATEHGFYDLCWNGEYLLGAEMSDIIVFDREGNYVYSIPTNLEAVHAIAFDPASGNYFIGSGASDIREIDTTGTVFNTYNHDLNVTGLCWDENDADGYCLYILSTEPTITISKMSIVEREVLTVGTIFGMPDNVSGGCVISDTVNPIYRLFFGMWKTSTSDKIKGWQLDRLFNHFSLTPDEGSISSAATESFTLGFDAGLLETGTYDGIIRFSHNGFGGTTDIPVTLHVSETGVTPLPAGDGMVKEYELFANYPNPFNPATTIRFAVPCGGQVQFSIYDILGRQIMQKKMNPATGGQYDFEFDGSALASGIYFFKMEAGGYNKSIKLLLLK